LRKWKEANMTDTAVTHAEQQTGEITIQAPNGLGEATKFHPQQTVAHTLDHAVQEYGKKEKGWLDPSVPYILVLGATPLEPSQTLERAGVTAGATLKIRAKATPGDGDAPRAI